MKKKILALVMCIVMVMTILPVYAFAEDTTSEWTYKVLSEEDKTAEITGYTGSATATELVLPRTIDGYTMVSIGNSFYKFKYNSNCPLTSVTIPNSYKRIGNSCFYNCRNLETINLPHTLEYIGFNSFNYSKLHFDTRDYLEIHHLPVVFYIGEYLIVSTQDTWQEFPDIYMVRPGTRLIAAGAFLQTRDLKNVIIPYGVKYINSTAFGLCLNFKSVVIPNTVTRIEDSTFAASDRLSAVVIPSNVEYIDETAFESSRLQFMTIYGISGTLAETFANEHGATFVDLIDVLFGDIDGDGTVTVNDYASTESCAIGNTEFDGNQEVIGDMNGDCVIDAFDAAAIDRIVGE